MSSYKSLTKVWRVQPQGIQVLKLIYLSSKEFKLLKELRDRFVARLLGERMDPGEAKKSIRFESHRFIGPLRDVLNPDADNSPTDYEATKMWSTRDSLLWGWRRVEEYFKTLLEYDRKVFGKKEGLLKVEALIQCLCPTNHKGDPIAILRAYEGYGN